MIEFIGETHSHPSKILKGLQRIATVLFLSEVFHEHFLCVFGTIAISSL